MGWTTQLRGFIRALRSGTGSKPGRHKGHALARTFKDGTTIVGANAPNSSLGNVGNKQRDDLMVEASERYDASFDED